MPGARSAPRVRRCSAKWVRKAMTSCFTSRSISSMRATSNDGLAALLPDGLGGSLGDHAQLGHGGGRMRFDLEPDAKARLRRSKFRPSAGACSGESWAGSLGCNACRLARRGPWPQTRPCPWPSTVRAEPHRSAVGGVHTCALVAQAGLAIRGEQQRPIEVDPVGGLGEQDGGRHRQRGRHHAADHDLEAARRGPRRQAPSASVSPPALSSLMLTAS